MIIELEAGAADVRNGDRYRVRRQNYRTHRLTYNTKYRERQAT